jgi:hypothetical protein
MNDLDAQGFPNPRLPRRFTPRNDMLGVVAWRPRKDKSPPRVTKELSLRAQRSNLYSHAGPDQILRLLRHFAPRNDMAAGYGRAMTAPNVSLVL